MVRYVPSVIAQDGTFAEFRILGGITLKKHLFSLTCLLLALILAWPGTFAEMNGKTYKLWRAQALEDSTDAPAGTVVAAGKEGLDISAGGRLLRVTQIQAPGKKRMNTGDYLRGNLIEIGTVMR